MRRRFGATGQPPAPLKQIFAAETLMPQLSEVIAEFRQHGLSQSTIPKLVRRTALAQEVKKFDAFAQASLHHLRAADHFADNRRDFAGAQIEAPIKLLDRIEDFGVAQMRIM